MKDKKKSSISGISDMTTAQKAAIVKGQVSEAKGRKEKFGKIDRSLPFAPVTPEMRGDQYALATASRQLNDRSRTLARLNAQSAKLAALKKKRGSK
jgi:hypothetical protein